MVRPHGDLSRVDVRFFVYEDVLDELTFAAEYREEVSLAILLGSFALDRSGPYVEVSGFEEFVYVGAETSLYAKTRSSLKLVHRHLGQASGVPEHHVVGLFASVPGSEASMTPELARTHLSLFNIPFQMALSFDPTLRRLGAYVRPPRSRFQNTPFWTVGAARPDEPAEQREEGGADEPADSLGTAISDVVDESR
ncbi:MAG: hypothetical protein ACQEVA_01555 [Myxococcota bacterium]